MPCIDRRDIPPFPAGPLVPCNHGVSYAWKFPGSSIAILYTIFATPELLLFYNSAVLIVVELYVWNKGCEFNGLISYLLICLGFFYWAMFFLWIFCCLIASMTPSWASSSPLIFLFLVEKAPPPPLFDVGLLSISVLLSIADFILFCYSIVSIMTRGTFFIGETFSWWFP